MADKKAEAQKSLGQVIANYLDSIMHDRKNMPNLETAVDEWIKSQLDHSQEARTKVLAQLQTAMGCLESIYGRVSRMY